MLKPRLAATALVALAVAVPTAAAQAAHAAPAATNTYRSTTLKDPVDDVFKASSGARVADPAIDIYKLVGYRYAKNFVVTVGFKHLTAAAYTHRLVDFADTYDGDTRRDTLIDLSVGARGSRPTAAVYVDKYTSSGDESTYELPCPGAKASPSYSTGKVTYTLPVDCLKNYDQAEAEMSVATGRWSEGQWRRSAIETGNPTNLDYTEAEDLWAWDRDPAQRGRVAHPHRFTF